MRGARDCRPAHPAIRSALSLWDQPMHFYQVRDSCRCDKAQLTFEIHVKVGRWFCQSNRFDRISIRRLGNLTTQFMKESCGITCYSFF
jgi:hypothetical protein